jgi:PAS domain S-box-containing protein
MIERWRQSSALAYFIAVVGSGLVIACRFVPEGAVRSFVATLVFLCAVSLAGATGGWKPGFLTTALSALGAVYFLVRPYYTFRVANTGDLLRIVGSVAAGIAISILCEALHRAWRRVEDRQQRLERALEQLQIVTDSMSASISHCSRDLRYRWVSKSYAEWMGLPIDQIIGRPIVEVVGRDAFEQLRPRFEQVLAGQRVQYEETVDYKGIGRRCINAVNTPTMDASGVPDGWVAVVLDVTERRQVEQALAESEGRFRQLAETINEVFWMTDPELTVTYYVSPAYERVWGRTCRSLYDKPRSFLESVHPDDRERVLAMSLDKNSRGEPSDQEYRIVMPNGSIRWIRHRAFPVRDDEGRVFRMAGIAEDITEKKRAEEALKEADRRKDEFLATLAHELRNPLAPICNAVELMQSAQSDPHTMEEARRVLKRQLGHLVRLIDDLLEISRITRGKVQLRKERVELAAAIRSAVEATRPLIDAAGHELTLSVPPEPIYLDADPTRLVQIFSNLLNNAAKYAQKGGHIWLSVRRETSGVSVSVRDTGIGIAPEHLTHIFEMFSQVAPALERSAGGLGIGLALVRGLVELHGGTIEAHSEGAGQGSEFIVHLPVAGGPPRPSRPEASTTPRTTTAAESKPRVLVVDDNADMTATLALLLERTGHHVHVAHDGLEAVDAAATFDPDVVLLDIGLPKLNGYEVAKRIREHAGTRKPLLVALTGWGQQEDRRRATEAGFDHHLTKPVDTAALMRLLAPATSSS